MLNVRIIRKQMLFLFCLMIVPGLALVQGADCPQIVEAALDAADEFCADTGRNQACYGHIALTADLRGDVADVVFEQPGDMVDVVSLDTLRLNPMNVETGDWGVALMRLQANLPNTLPGQNITFLMFGDVEIRNAVSGDDPPNTEIHAMQAFYLRTGIGDAPCEGAPQSGLVVQTPQGAGSVVFNINGVDVEMGSTVFFQADAEEGMMVSTLEGAAHVSDTLGSQPILAGTWVRIPLDETFSHLVRPDGRAPIHAEARSMRRCRCACSPVTSKLPLQWRMTSLLLCRQTLKLNSLFVVKKGFQIARTILFLRASINAS
jgi:hypothetical protein